LGRNPRLNISWNAISLNRWSYYYNVVGNVLGVSTPKQTVYQFATSAQCGAGHGIYRLGYPNMGNCDTTSYDGASPPGVDAKVQATLLRWANYDYVHSAVQRDTAELPAGVPAPGTDPLPASLVYSGAPPWWPASVPWPPIGPDVSGGNGEASGHANKIPAQICWETLDLINGGAFNAAKCYANTSSPDGGAGTGGAGTGGAGGSGGGASGSSGRAGASTGGASSGGANASGGASGARSANGSDDSGGCSCKSAGSDSRSSGTTLLIALGAVLCRHRRRRAPQSPFGDARSSRTRRTCSSSSSGVNGFCKK